MIRSKVGDTHEDVDGLFGMLKVNMKNKDIIIPFDLEAAIRDTRVHQINLQAETSKKPTAVDTAPRHRVRKTLSAV